jgi:protein TonB
MLDRIEPLAKEIVLAERPVAAAPPKPARDAVPKRRPAPQRPESIAAAPVMKPPPAAHSLSSANPSPSAHSDPLEHQRGDPRNAPTVLAAALEPARRIIVAPTTTPRFRADYLSNPPPAYPRRARRDGIEGTVTLKVLVTAAGTPGEVKIEVSSGSESLDRAALNAVRAWQFVPARRAEEAVDAWVRVPVVFRLESG